MSVKPCAPGSVPTISAVKRHGHGVRILVCCLPVKSPWLNPIEPKWVHGQRAIVEPARLLSAQEVADRVCSYHGCAHEPTSRFLIRSRDDALGEPSGGRRVWFWLPSSRRGGAGGEVVAARETRVDDHLSGHPLYDYGICAVFAHCALFAGGWGHCGRWRRR